MVESQLKTLDKLRTFKTFKNNYKLENYLCMNGSEIMQSLYSKWHGGG